jgi:hypothetical protein
VATPTLARLVFGAGLVGIPADCAHDQVVQLTGRQVKRVIAANGRLDTVGVDDNLPGPLAVGR